MKKLRIGTVWYEDKYFCFNNQHESVYIDTPERALECDLVVFWGGEDISPSLYGERVVQAYAKDKPSMRDAHEREVFETIRDKVPSLGVCRGGQLQVALCGGKLWQHVEMHTRPHYIKTVDGDILATTSAHHQMFRLTPEMKLLGWSVDILSKYKWAENEKGVVTQDPEPEIALMPNGMHLAVQGHPEWMKPTSALTTKVRELVNKHLQVKL